MKTFADEPFTYSARPRVRRQAKENSLHSLSLPRHTSRTSRRQTGNTTTSSPGQHVHLFSHLLHHAEASEPKICGRETGSGIFPSMIHTSRWFREKALTGPAPRCPRSRARGTRRPDAPVSLEAHRSRGLMFMSHLHDHRKDHRPAVKPLLMNFLRLLRTRAETSDQSPLASGS